MRKGISCLILMLTFMFAFQTAEASTLDSIDFTISHEINIIGYKGSTELMVDPLIIDNNSDLYDLNVKKFEVETMDGWECVSFFTEFDELEEDSNKFGFSTELGYDISDELNEWPYIGSGETKSIGLVGRVTKTNTEYDKGHIANFIIEIEPYLERNTILYEDGTLVINETKKGSANSITKHGPAYKIYPALDEDNTYVFQSASKQPWSLDRPYIKSIEFGSYVQPTSTAYWFYRCQNLRNFSSINLDMSECESTYMMFYSAGNNVEDIFKLDGLADWEVSKVKTFAGMFNNAGLNATIWDVGDLSNWNMSSAENLSNMFCMAGSNSTSWYVGNLGKWDVKNVRQMNGTFKQAGEFSGELNLGDLKNWDTSNVEDMGYLFYKTGYSADIWNIGDLSNWNLQNTQNTERMFCNAAKMAKTVDIGPINWDLCVCENAKEMFYGFASNSELLSFNNIRIYDRGSYTSFMREFNNVIVSIYTGDAVELNENIFLQAATKEGSSIKLIPQSEVAQEWCSEMVGLYGPDGSLSQGNITI